MTTVTADPILEMPDRRVAGWRVVARKELADHLQSIRFAILLVLTALAGLAAVDSAAGEIRDVASAASGSPSVFLLLFTVSPDRIPSFLELIGFLGPLLGIAFGFDAINAERSAGTLPRLVSQPIHRDDVITGKFAAGLALIALAVVSLTAVVSGYGVVELGITPGPGDLARITTFALAGIVYVGVWLALAVLVSVVTRRSSTAVLGCMAVWLVLTLFNGLVFGALADVISPAGGDASAEELIENARTEIAVSRISPEELYNEVSTVMLNPQIRTIGIVNPRQLDQTIPDTLPWDQSVLLVWPHIVALVATIVVMFIAAFILFMRQEVRA
ncbi:MAG: ABC transporter permease [Acidimicrobiales bacterium]